MAKKIKLDSVDRKILADLQDNGRMTNVELAARAVFLPHLVCAVYAHWKMRGLYAVIMLILMVTRLAIR